MKAGGRFTPTAPAPATPARAAGAAILIYRDKRAELSGYEAHTTNNRMELLAADSRRCSALKEPCAVRVYSDSAYLVNAFRAALAGELAETQLAQERQKARRKPGSVEEILLELTEDASTSTWIKVKGHAGQPLETTAATSWPPASIKARGSAV